MKLYRIKHKLTGLYFRTSGGRPWKKRDQLHEEGKIYTREPALVRVFGVGPTDIYMDNERYPVRPEDFEVEEFVVELPPPHTRS